MAEYVEVMKQKKRMCNSTLCCKCDIFHLSGENIENCPQFISNNPSKAEKIIMSWAAKHPEPVYPTWIAWLMSKGIIPTNYMAANSTDSGVRAGTFYVTSKAFAPISADIAKKLGIQPKENN